MLDIKLLGFLKIMCEVLDQQQVGRKFSLLTKETSSSPGNRKNATNSSNAGTINNCINMPDYFSSSANREPDKVASRILTEKNCNDFSDVFMGVCFLRVHLTCKVREDLPLLSPAQKSSLCTTRTTQRRINRLQTIIVSLDVNETSKWCNSFMLVPEVNGEIRLYLGLARLNKLLIRPIHRDLALNEILPSLTSFKKLMLIDACAGYLILK